MTERASRQPVRLLALAILSSLMFVIFATGDVGSPLFVEGFDQFPLSMACFIGCVVVGVVAGVLMSRRAMSGAAARIIPRTIAHLSIGLSALVTWYALSVVAGSYGVNDLVLRCYVSADGACDGPVPFDWTPYLTAGASVALFLVAALTYLAAATHARMSPADRAIAVIVMALSTVPLLSIVAAGLLLRRGHAASRDSTGTAQSFVKI